jgi:hypothetical protein
LNIENEISDFPERVKMMVAVYITSDERMADMAVGLLENEAIVATKVSHAALSYFPFSTNPVGNITVQVHEENFDRAWEILSARFSDYTPPGTAD